jgi:outer membrane receptor protein involved in Fe transport
MSYRLILCALVALPTTALAQQSTDSTHQHGDSLVRQPIRLAPITVTATPARREDPVSVVRVSPRTIQQTPATDAYDLMRQAAGVEVHQQGQGPGFASNASVRGFSSDHSADIALWVDGVPNNEPVNGHAEGYNDWNLLFPEAIRDIDVLKGPVSALYGNFALSGVVNVRTLERMQGTSLWFDPGSYGRLEGGILHGFDHDSTAAVFGLRGVREDGWRPNSGYAIGQAHARFIHRLGPSTTMDAGAELYGTRWDSPGYLSDSQYTIRDYNSVTNATDGGFKRRAQERVSFRVLTGGMSLWRTTLYATQGRWQFFGTIPAAGGSGEGTGSQTEEEDLRYGFGFTSALTWGLPRGDLTIGTEGRLDHSKYANWFTTGRTRDSAQTLVTGRQLSGGLFVEATTDPTPHLRLTLGGRVDGIDTRSTPETGTATRAGTGVVSPKFGALYHLPGAIDLYANVGRGFRATDGVISDPSLPLITTWAYETGLRFDTHGVSGTVALFQMDVSNEQTFNPVTLASTSGGSSRRRGVEVEAQVRATQGLTLSTDWTLNDAKYRRLVSEDGDTLDGARVFNTAKYVGSAAVEFSPFGATWRLRASTDVTGPYTPFDEPGVERPAYALAHLSGGKRFGATQLELGVRNLFNTAYRELEAGGFVAPGQTRSVFAMVRYDRF